MQGHSIDSDDLYAVATIRGDLREKSKEVVISLKTGDILFTSEDFTTTNVGSKENPILVSTCEEFLAIENDLTSHQKLANDIDFADYKVVNDNYSQIPNGNVQQQYNNYIADTVAPTFKSATSINYYAKTVKDNYNNGQDIVDYYSVFD